MKVAIAQITTQPGRLEENCVKIISCIDKARDQGADIVVFPELCLPGYAVLDLAYDRDFLLETRKALDRIAAACKGVCAIIGFIDYDPTIVRPGLRPALYNSAAVIEDGQLKAVVDKNLFPNYDIFFEDRYFLPARRLEPVTLRNRKIGIQICEDLWDQHYPQKIAKKLVEQGAELLINISASPFSVDKLEERSALIHECATSLKTNFLYVNLPGVFDGYEGEVIFDGQSLAISADGRWLACCKAFGEDFSTIDLSSAEAIDLPKATSDQQILDALSFGISEFFIRMRATTAIIGLSGGIDSSLVAALCQRALGAASVRGVLMSSHLTSRQSVDDALKLANNLGIQAVERPIVPEYNAWLEEFRRAEKREPSSLTRQNKQARIRGSILMEISNELPGSLVINTGNKTELAVGYCTLYGDMCGALSAIGDLSKEQVYSVSRYINKRAGREIIPKSILDRIPTAELESGQTDRDNLPADYPLLSPLVSAIVEEGLPFSELVKRYDSALVEATISLINRSEFKRRQAAPSLRISRRAFGNGRRMPNDLR